MTELKQQILKELSALEETALRLKSVALHVSKQTDLEVAILTEQNKVLREKNAAASDLVSKSISILKKMN